MKFRPQDIKEYKRLARNARRKVNRIKENVGIDVTGELDPSLEVPFRVDIKTQDDFASRKEFNQWKEQIERFTNRYNQSFDFKRNEAGVVYTKSQETRAELLFKRGERLQEQEMNKINNLPFRSGGQETGQTVGERLGQFQKPDTIFTGNVRGLDFSKLTSQKSLEENFKRLKKQADARVYMTKKDQLKENFLNALETTFNGEADEVIKLIKELYASEFYELFNHIDEIDFARIYPSKTGSDEAEGVLEKIQSEIEKFFEGGRDLPLKGI